MTSKLFPTDWFILCSIAQEKGCYVEREVAWKKYDEASLDELEALAVDYIDFISENKTERECAAAVAYNVPREFCFRARWKSSLAVSTAAP